MWETVFLSVIEASVLTSVSATRSFSTPGELMILMVGYEGLLIHVTFLKAATLEVVGTDELPVSSLACHGRQFRHARQGFVWKSIDAFLGSIF
jgi:hypothetical protein